MSLIPVVGSFVFTPQTNRSRVSLEASRDHPFLVISAHLFCPASKCDCCVHMCPNKLIFGGGGGNTPSFETAAPNEPDVENTLNLSASPSDR